MLNLWEPPQSYYERSTFIPVSNRSEPFGFIAQITSYILHLLHRLLRRVFHITGCLRNAISNLLGILLHVFRFWESATHLLQAFAQEALRLVPTHEKDDQTGNHTDSNKESCDKTIHASISFLL